MAVAMPKNSGSGMPVDPEAEGGEHALRGAGRRRPEQRGAPDQAKLREQEPGVLAAQRRQHLELRDHLVPVEEHHVQGEQREEEAEQAARRARRRARAATAAERDAISVSAPLSRSLRLSGEKPNRPSQPVAACIHPLAVPPGPSEATSVAVRAAPRLTKSEMKPTTAPTMRCPAASTITTEASTGWARRRRSAS